MAKKSSARQASRVREPGEPERGACQCDKVTVESVAAALFVGAYPAKSAGYKPDRIAQQAIEAAETFMKQLSRR